MSGTGFGPMLAARGYRYVLQASRGTDGSGGSHSYFDEVPDGRSTADWIAEQPWFNGSLGTYGGSYMGYTQWALASTRPAVSEGDGDRAVWVGPTVRAGTRAVRTRSRSSFRGTWAR